MVNVAVPLPLLITLAQAKPPTCNAVLDHSPGLARCLRLLGLFHTQDQSGFGSHYFETEIPGLLPWSPAWMSEAEKRKPSCTSASPITIEEDHRDGRGARGGHSRAGR
jgi:hypothetical protein